MPIPEGKYFTEIISLEPFVIDRRQTKIFSFPLNEDTAWLLGLYVAEGTVSMKTNQFDFSLNKQTEMNIAYRIQSIMNGFGLNAKIYPRVQDNSMRVSCCCAILGRAFSTWCGYLCENMKIPDFILFHRNLALLRAFLDGYTTGDGSNKITISNKLMTTMATTSKLLAMQLQQAYSRLGIFANINIHHHAGTHVIQGRTSKPNGSL